MKHIKWIAPVGFWYFLISVPQPNYNPDPIHHPQAPIQQLSHFYNTEEACRRANNAIGGQFTTMGQIFTSECQETTPQGYPTPTVAE